ncbi:MAG: hypothetical protein KGM16_16065 [Bacteroidota bacterium]|nr:hypothetical protein [Bacteroidota bacterium]
MFFWNKFCGLIILFFILTDFSYAQYAKEPVITAKKNSLKNNFLSFRTVISPDSKNVFLTFYKPNSGYLLHQSQTVHPIENFNATYSSIIPGDFATCDYGFFCRQELKIEKTTNIPIRFRLGSLAQCNYYEGKH